MGATITSCLGRHDNSVKFWSALEAGHENLGRVKPHGLNLNNENNKHVPEECRQNFQKLKLESVYENFLFSPRSRSSPACVFRRVSTDRAWNWNRLTTERWAYNWCSVGRINNLYSVGFKLIYGGISECGFQSIQRGISECGRWSY